VWLAFIWLRVCPKQRVHTVRTTLTAIEARVCCRATLTTGIVFKRHVLTQVVKHHARQLSLHRGRHVMAHAD
jgi:hypothetical protein